jgi:aryl-alcohol dehydrogenase-like predicted oxidoreductase
MPRVSDVIMDDHWPTGKGGTALLNWTQEMLAEKALVALTALKRLESERGLGVHEGTTDQVRRALEAAGILFIESGQGRGACFLTRLPIQTRQARVRRVRSPT